MSTELPLWLQVPNQGYNKYGKGIVGPGSSEVLQNAVDLYAKGDPNHPQKIWVPKKGEKIPVSWAGLVENPAVAMRYPYNPPIPLEGLPEELKEYAKKMGWTTFPDYGFSESAEQMETTMRDAKTHEYLRGRLQKPGPVIDAYKDAHVGATIPTNEIEYIVDSEELARALREGRKPVPRALKPGEIIASDALGCYAPKVTPKFLNNNSPGDAKGELVHKTLKWFSDFEQRALSYEKEGFIKSAQRYIDIAWKGIKNIATEQQFARILKHVKV